MSPSPPPAPRRVPGARFLGTQVYYAIAALTMRLGFLQRAPSRASRDLEGYSTTGFSLRVRVCGLEIETWVRNLGLGLGSGV